MKSLDEILKQEPVYHEDFNSIIDVIGNFEDIYITTEEYNAKEPPYKNVDGWIKAKERIDNKMKDYEEVNILFASYTYVCYDGSAFVLFEKDGKLYEVNGSHCSCYGLEGQWEPEETSLESIEYRLRNGDYAFDNCSKELAGFLGYGSKSIDKNKEEERHERSN